MCIKQQHSWNHDGLAIDRLKMLRQSVISYSATVGVPVSITSVYKDHLLNQAVIHKQQRCRSRESNSHMLVK